MLIDSHIHLDFPAFDDDRTALLQQAREAGISGFVVPATTRASWAVIARLAKTTADVYPAYGIHPYFSTQHSLEDVEDLGQHIQANLASTVALGEIGLDYYLNELDRDHQMVLFDAQLALAVEFNLPLILHARKAVDAVIGRLRHARLSRGIVHSFNGSYVQATRLIDMGFKLGFGGALSYPRATRLRTLVGQLPLDALCLETDAPDQPVLSLHGQRNLPVALLEVAQCIADIRQCRLELIARHCTDNTNFALNIC